MATRTQKIRLGLFTAVAAGLLAVVLVVFGGVRFWAKRDRYRVLVQDTVYGLEVGAKVYRNGIRVGSVTDIEELPDDPSHVAVTIAIREGTALRSDTRAMLQLAGITGLKEIDLRGGTPAAAMLAPGSDIPQGDTMLDQLESEVRQIADRSGQLVDRAEQLLANITELSDPARYDEIVRGARVMAQNLAEASATLKTMVGENRVALRRSLDAIHATAESASTILDGEVTQLVGRANGFVGQLENLVRDNQGSLRAAMFDLRQASRSFKDLAREVRQRPSRLLFSKQPSERKLP